MGKPANLQAKLKAGQFVVTAEITPPLTASPDILLARARPLAGPSDAINVTDAAGARTAMSSFAAAALLAQAGIEPVLQITCRDRNRIALAADLLGAAALGVENLLILHGDDPSSGDQPDAKPVFDLDSRQMMALARTMRDEGALPEGRQIKSPPNLFIGAADTPIDPPADWHPDGLESKIASGAQFVQTQFCYDLGLAERYFARLRDAGITERLHIIAGIGPLASAKQARFMDQNLFGVNIPAALIKRLDGAADQAKEGRTICVELIDRLRAITGIAGVHIMAPMQPPEAIAEVIERAGLGTGKKLALA